jgi:hypothetical protein
VGKAFTSALLDGLNALGLVAYQIKQRELQPKEDQGEKRWEIFQ